MEKSELFLWVSLALILISGVIVFNNFGNLRKTFYWLLFPNFISVWIKKLWDKDFENTFRFELFLLLAALLVGLNYLMFRFFI